MIGEIVCPSVLLLGEVVMEPEKVAPYFGTVEKPECHMLYNVTTMASIWHTGGLRGCEASQEAAGGCGRFAQGVHLPSTICAATTTSAWGLDYGTLRQYGMEEVSHKEFLNDFFTGKYPTSFSRGELYNNDPVTRDARFCGTTASMCGIEKAGFCGDGEGMDQAIRLDEMLHAFYVYPVRHPRDLQRGRGGAGERLYLQGGSGEAGGLPVHPPGKILLGSGGKD